MGQHDKTRRSIIFSCNFTKEVIASGTLPALESDDPVPKKSDHLVAYATASLVRTVPFKWLAYSYHYYNAESAKKFGKWLAGMEWEELFLAQVH